MNKALFLDRDGVVNVERGEYTWHIEDFELTEGLIEFLRWGKDNGYLLIIISNQGGIGRGIYTKDDVEKAHQFLHNKLAEKDINLTDIYFCPHHPVTGKCLCRKPESIMLEKAIAFYQVDVSQSVFIGDSQRDVQAGANVGLHSVLIKPNENLCKYLDEIKRILNKKLI